MTNASKLVGLVALVVLSASAGAAIAGYGGATAAPAPTATPTATAADTPTATAVEVTRTVTPAPREQPLGALDRVEGRCPTGSVHETGPVDEETTDYLLGLDGVVSVGEVLTADGDRAIGVGVVDAETAVRFAEDGPYCLDGLPVVVEVVGEVETVGG